MRTLRWPQCTDWAFGADYGIKGEAEAAGRDPAEAKKGGARNQEPERKDRLQEDKAMISCSTARGSHRLSGTGYPLQPAAHLGRRRVQG